MDIIEEQTPGREDERRRIEAQGGWVKEERELQLSKLHSMDLSDPEIQQRAERVVKWVTIYRVNGELAVSRAIGDIDYKGEALSKYEYWAFPEGHDRVFHGDLVISIPECQVRWRSGGVWLSRILTLLFCNRRSKSRPSLTSLSLRATVCGTQSRVRKRSSMSPTG